MKERAYGKNRAKKYQYVIWDERHEYNSAGKHQPEH
jgi:hypothetical protein